MTLAISVVSDVICPWCLLGKRRLERALAESGETAEIEWLPFELNPDMPEDGMPREAYRAAKFGPERADLLDREMTERGAQEGVAFRFDLMRRTPSTRKAHRLLVHARSLGLNPRLKQALLEAYFEDGRDVGDDAELVAIAASVGLREEAARYALEDPKIDRTVAALEERAVAMGVSGVPFFIVDGRWAMSGAQPTDQWLSFLRDREAGRLASA